MKFMKSCRMTKPVSRLGSALVIITNTALAQDLSSTPKLCYSSPLSRSDRWILSTSRLKARLAIDSFGPRGMPDSHSTIITL